MRLVYSAKIARIWRETALLETRLHEHELRTFPLRGNRSHRGMDAKAARLIACRSHDTTLARAPDSNWLAPQFGIIALLDRRVERVHVNVNDLAWSVGWVRHGAHPVSLVLVGPSSWLAVIPVMARTPAPRARLIDAPMVGKAIPYTIGPSACPMKKLKACRENEEARADGASSVTSV